MGRAVRSAASVVLLAVLAMAGTLPAWADEPGIAPEVPAAPAAAEAAQGEGYLGSDDVTVSEEGRQALAEGAPFAANSFSRAQKGSNREVNGSYIGYAYYEGSMPDYAVAVCTESYVVAYVPPAAKPLCDIESAEDLDWLKRYFLALDAHAPNAGVVLSEAVPWYFTDQPSYEVDGIVYGFGVEAGSGKYYVTVLGADGSDVTAQGALAEEEQASGGARSGRPSFVDFLAIVPPDEVEVAPPPTGFAALGRFLATMDYSPLWVTLKTTGTAIVFIFVLGLAAAYFSLRIPKRAQDIADAVFTIPMVLPPTVCGFLLLLLLGRNTALGQWFIDVGFPLIFSWPATVIAAVVVAFPLMYRNARGAFEGLDPNMLDAARTLGWSNARIFFRLMLPLSWSSIAAGTVLSFARALGEFGATLFLAGNYAGITRTIPIAIYFEWMSGNIDVALFWTVVILIFSFIVILFINLWGRRTTRYRRREVSDL
nr:molybdate ABC transporter permease subunit [Adlercreutzia aquisgranensis]